MRSKQIFHNLALAVLFGLATTVTAAPVLLGQMTFSGATGDIDVNPNGDLVYIASGFGQTGWIRVNASNPLAMSQMTLAGGWGGGVAVDPVTGRYASTSGYGGSYAIFNSNDTMFAAGGLSGCGGSLAYGGGKFGISTQCSDHLAIVSATTGAMQANILSNGVGSTMNYNGATNTFYQSRTPSFFAGNNTLAVNGNSFAQQNVPGLVQGANPVTNRVYVYNGAGTDVRDGITHANLATIPAAGFVSVDELLNRVYIGMGTNVNVYDGLSNALIESFTTPFSIQRMDIASGDDRLYVIGSGNNLLVYGIGGAQAPVPATLALLLVGLLGLAIRRRAS